MYARSCVNSHTARLNRLLRAAKGSISKLALYMFCTHKTRLFYLLPYAQHVDIKEEKRALVCAHFDMYSWENTAEARDKLFLFNSHTGNLIMTSRNLTQIAQELTKISDMSEIHLITQLPNVNQAIAG